MKKITATVTLLLIIAAAFGQDLTKSVSSFNKIVVSPRINLILIKGDKESVRLVCHNIAPEKVNIRVRGNKLRVFLDHARIVEKQVRYRDDHYNGKKGIYENVSITAYVTYRELKALEIRGETEISADEPIVTKKLKLRAFGECEIDLAAVQARKFKASFYGETKLRIRKGEINREVFRVFGESRIDTKNVVCATASVRMFGEARLSVNATDEVHFSGFGESNVSVTGSAIITKGLTIGHNFIARE